MPTKTVEKTKIIVKEKIPEKVSQKKVSRPRASKSRQQDEMIKVLMESNIELQHKSADMVHAVKELTKRMDSMVALFEEAASQIKSGTDEPLMKKLEDLLDQNKTIAKGLILLEKYVRERASSSTGMSMPSFRSSGPPPPEPF
jgi:hypothetical protein